MTTHYTSVSVSGYNSGAPPDDGSTGSDNTVTWAKHKTKLGDPLKTAVEQVNTNLVSAFNDVPKMATGSYTGDGATSKAITGLGFQPRYVKIVQRRTSAASTVLMFETWDTINDDNVNGGAIYFAAGAITFETDAIISLNADGFTVDDAGSDSAPNANGALYNWVAFG